VAILVSVVGATLPVWGPLAASPLHRFWQARAYRKLGPLWAALQKEFPEITLDGDTGHPGLS
jgi:hypothetical protein